MFSRKMEWPRAPQIVRQNPHCCRKHDALYRDHGMARAAERPVGTYGMLTDGMPT
jgi:hypothetical protein